MSTTEGAGTSPQNIEKIITAVLHESHRRQVEEAMDALEEGPEGLYGSSAD
ncbi:MAG: hypothetical protein M3Q60_17125 [Actinomycetota bacterium]|nr:hypothetical protein [Actinomycetota bacterium]